MDLQLPFNFTTLLLLSIFILFLIKAWRKSKLQKQFENLPPSPPKLPIIGHLHHLLGGLPHQALANITRKYGRILHLQLGEISTIVISTREGAKEVLKDQDPACADRPGCIGFKIMWYNYADLAFSPYNENWRQMRKICVQELLSARNVKSFGYIMQDEVYRLVEFVNSSSGESINLTKKVFQMSSSVICRAALGKEMKGREELIAMMTKGLAMAGGFEIADLFPSSKLLNLLCWNKYRLLWMRRKIDPILDDMVEQHKLKQRGEFGGEDLVDALLRVEKDEKLKFSITRENIKGLIFDLFAAGTESTSTTIDWVMVELMRNPHVMMKLQAEVREAFNAKKKLIKDSDIQGLKYLRMVVKETLRLHPPAPVVPRACRDECTVDGYSIPLKARVMIDLLSLGRDPNYWHHPETFQPERFENSHIDFLGNNFEFLPFGSGKRMCPGIDFGLANVEHTLARLLYHFDWKMPEGVAPIDLDMAERGGLIISRKDDLYLVATTYLAPY